MFSLELSLKRVVSLKLTVYPLLQRRGLAKSMCALYDCIEKRKYTEVGEGQKGSETLAEGLEEDYIPFSCHGY